MSAWLQAGTQRARRAQWTEDKYRDTQLGTKARNDRSLGPGPITLCAQTWQQRRGRAGWASVALLLGFFSAATRPRSLQLHRASYT